MTNQYWTKAEREEFKADVAAFETLSLTPDEARRILATVEALERALRNVDRVLTPTDPSAFSADDERRRIGTAKVLIAQLLAALGEKG